MTSPKVHATKPRNIYTITRGKHKGTKFPEQGSWHQDRKKKIVAKHPEVEDLYGTEIKTFYYLIPLWVFHVGMAIFLRDLSWPTWLLFVYTIGAWNAFQIQALGHEAVHGLVWKNSYLNKMTASFAFLPVFCSPFGSIWGVEHLWHHNVVVDKVLRFGKMSDSFGFKLAASAFTITIANVFLWVASKLAFVKIFVTFAKYAAGKSKSFFPTSFDAILFRDAPGILSWWFVINEIVSNLFNWALIHYFGWTAFFYLFLSNGFGNGLHPLGFRNVQEHMVRVPNQPTYSVYHSHPLDWLIGFNINYHVEHHDFPRIPWSRLPQLKKIAPEFYNHLYSYTSYTQVMKDFFNEKGIPAETFFEGALELFGKPNRK